MGGFNTIGGGLESWHHVDTLIVDTAPGTYTSWQTVDVSSIVGSRHAMLFIAVKANLADKPCAFHFRSNSDDDSIVDANVAQGCAGVYISTALKIGYVIIETDETGKFQWRTSEQVNSAAVRMWLRGYS
mgnify:CR=1 FL=1